MSCRRQTTQPTVEGAVDIQRLKAAPLQGAGYLHARPTYNPLEDDDEYEYD
jgi:hypothetical protein